MDGPPPDASANSGDPTNVGRPRTRPTESRDPGRRPRTRPVESRDPDSPPQTRPVDGRSPGRPPRTRPAGSRGPDGRPRTRPSDTPDGRPRTRPTDARDLDARRRPRPAPSWFDDAPPTRPRQRTEPGAEPEPRRELGRRPARARPAQAPGRAGQPARATQPSRGTRPARGPRPSRGRRPDPATRRPPPRGGRPAGRLALPGGITLPSPVRPRPRGRGAAPPTTTRRLTALLLLAAIGVGIAALVGAFSSGQHTQPVPKLPAISARSIASQRGAPATVALDTTFGGAHPPTGKLSTLELDLARGFHFDPRAAPTCTPSQARAGACPADSAIGSGSGEILVHGPYLPRTSYDVTAAVYLTAPTHRGDIAGLALEIVQEQSQLHATLLGRVIPLRTSRYSIALRFADASRGLSRDYELILRQIALKLQAGRTVDSQTYHLLTNPTPCVKPGWPLQLSMTSATNAWIYHGTASCGSSTS
ncbi:MAG TPA: hypothetical protein VFW09_19855 [Solirubrobacteraceae bacterium]|nr:hypothetical protein [Solirubrobacteraceae bacterium]